jgi:hypothetical protein
MSGDGMLSRARSIIRSVRSNSLFPQEEELTNLANKAGSDKGNRALNRHHFTRVYRELFKQFRDRPIRLLEIGLLHNQNPAWGELCNIGSRNRKNYLLGKAKASRAPSLEMWARYFAKATIYGFDLNDFSGVRIPRCTILRGDMGSREDLSRLIEETGGDLNIIIDDASHASHHQQIALGVLFPHLKEGGFYIIEDLSYQPPDIEPADAPKTVTLLRQLEVNRRFPSPFLSSKEIAAIESGVSRLAMFDSLTPDKALASRDAIAVMWKA